MTSVFQKCWSEVSGAECPIVFLSWLKMEYVQYMMKRECNIQLFFNVHRGGFLIQPSECKSVCCGRSMQYIVHFENDCRQRHRYYQKSDLHFLNCLGGSQFGCLFCSFCWVFSCLLLAPEMRRCCLTFKFMSKMGNFSQNSFFMMFFLRTSSTCIELICRFLIGNGCVKGGDEGKDINST